jgi:lipoyl(octanoyl) transferase
MLTRLLGLCDWARTAEAMRAFTEARSADTPDELWIAEHEPVFTQGVGGRAEHVRVPGEVPVRRSDRGGQVTYHGPGQVVAYPLVDLRRQGIFVKEYVYRLETAVLRVLEHFGITGHRVAGAPGIYVRLADPFAHTALTGPADPRGLFKGLGKIAALGIKVTRHRAYHGVALNVAMDLEPFSRIDPCGYPGLATVDLARLGIGTTWQAVAERLAAAITHQFDR